LQREAMQSSIQMLGDAHRQSVEIMGKPSSIADELAKLKSAGLLNVGGNGGFNFADLKELLAWGIPLLKEQGIIGKAAAATEPKKELDRALELIDVIQGRFGKAAKGEPDIWPLVIQTFGPSVVKAVETISSNIADIFRTRAAMAGVTVPTTSNPETKPAEPAAPALPAATPKEQPPTAQDYVKLRLVALVLDELQEEKPDPENIANWLEMTAPQLAQLLAKTPEDGVLNFLNADAILAQIGNDEKAIAFKKAIIAELVKDAAEVTA